MRTKPTALLTIVAVLRHNYDSSGDEAEVAAMEAEVAFMESDVANGGGFEEGVGAMADAIDAVESLLSLEDGDSPAIATLPSVLYRNPLAIFACDGDRNAFYSAVGAFAVTAGQTIYWALRKNPLRTWQSLQAAATSLVAVNVMYGYYTDCLAE